MKNIFFIFLVGLFIFVGYTYKPDSYIVPNIELSTTQKDKTNVSPELFRLPDYSGNEISSNDFKGKVIVINSWAAWCPFCKEELNDFTLLQEEFGDKIAVIAIDRAESLSKVKEFTDSIGVTNKMTFLLDGTDSFYKSIGGFAMPETIFVDIAGDTKLHKRGPMKLDEMREHILKIIGEGN